MTITLSSPVFFRNGKEGVSSVVGVESACNRVARYGFTSPHTGASAVRLSFSGMWPGNGTQPTAFRFYIGTDPTAYSNAGASDACHGLVTADSGGTNFTGSADVLLLPSTQYYLFLFPDTTNFGWYYWEGSGVMTLSGGSYSTPTLSVSTAELGQSLTVFTNPHSAQFTHSLSYELGELSGVIAENVAESVSWTPPLSLASQLPNTDRGLCRIYCTTYQNGTQLGEKQSVTLTLTVPESIIPTVSAIWQDKTPACDLFGTPVQLVSALTVTVTGQGAYGSTVVSQTVSLNGQPYAGGTLMQSGELVLGVTVTDSRGRTAGADYTVTVAAYTPPQLSLSAHRCTIDGTADDTGEYCQVTVRGSVHPLEGNAGTLMLSFADTEAVTGEFSKTYLLEAPSTETLPLSAALSDALLSSSRDMVLSVGYATLDFLKGGRGIAFGTTATSEGFTCAMDAEFLGKVKGTIFDAIYPVNSIYLSYSHQNPADLFGGIWERLENAFLWACGAADTIGATGGEKTHTLTVSELPAHGHSLQHSTDGGNTWQESDGVLGRDGDFFTDESYMGTSDSVAAYAQWQGRVGPTGAGQPHNNMPPYIQVSVWRRTA